MKPLSAGVRVAEQNRRELRLPAKAFRRLLTSPHCESPRISLANNSTGLAKEAYSFRGIIMAKRPAAKAPTKKATKAAAPAIKPVKQAMTKSALINLIAEENEIPRKTAVGVYKTIENAFLGSVHPRGLGEFSLPGLLKVNLRKVPARKAGTLVRNPATGEMIKGAAKPASIRVKIRALSKLKSAAAP